jgi:hypothetical protein
MKLMFCSCAMCRYGRKRWGNHTMITKLKRSARHKVKQMLKHGFTEVPEKVSVPYTD